MKDEKQRQAIDIGAFFKNSGYKILILGILALVILKKDLAFSINLKSPQRKSQPKVAPAPEQRGTIKKESKITENNTSKNNDGTSKSGIITGSSELSGFQRLEKVDKKIKDAYIRRFSHVAVDEMRKFKIPASVVLAQALLSSSAGTSEVAKRGNNHFNLTCDHSSKETFNTTNGDCFRLYSSPWRGFRAHSEFITNSQHIDFANYTTSDYKKWATGIGQAIFPKNKNYGEQLITIIEKYQLTRFDQ